MVICSRCTNYNIYCYHQQCMKVQCVQCMQCPWPLLYWLELGKLTVSKGIVELKFLCVQTVDAWQHQDTCI